MKRLRETVAAIRTLLEDLSQDEKKEREAVAKHYPKNPFVYASRMKPVTYTIGFKTASRKTTEPLWWTEGEDGGFKDLGRVNRQPDEFETSAEAEAFLRSKVLPHIEKWRSNETHLIIGW